MKRLINNVIALLLYIPLSYADQAPLRIVAPWEIKGMDPTGAGYVLTRMQVGETLVEVDKDGALMPGLARSWTVSEDLLTWTFPLRAGVTHHDGTPMTAETVAIGLNHALRHSSVLKTAPVEAIDVAGDGIRVRLSEPFSPLPALLAHYSTLILSADSYRDGEVVRLDATGPYRVTRFEPPQHLEVTAYSEYWGEAPAIESASYLAVGRGETRALMAESGDADIVYTLDPNSLERLEQRRVAQVFSESIPRTVVIKLNAAHPLLADARVRRIISDAIDREGVALGIMKDARASARQLFPPILGEWHDPAYDFDAFDPETVKARLAELGWQPGEDGVLVKDGRRFELSLVTYSSRPLLPVIATAVQDQLASVGIALDVRIENSSAVPQGHHDGTLELALLARNYGSVVDPLGTLLQDYAPGGSDWGAMNWSDDGLQQHLLRLEHSAGPSVRQAAVSAVTRTLHDQMPTIPVVYYQHTAAVDNRLEGFSLDPLERSYRLTELSWQ